MVTETCKRSQQQQQQPVLPRHEHLATCFNFALYCPLTSRGQSFASDTPDLCVGNIWYAYPCVTTLLRMSSHLCVGRPERLLNLPPQPARSSMRMPLCQPTARSHKEQPSAAESPTHLSDAPPRTCQDYATGPSKVPIVSHQWFQLYKWLRIVTFLD